MSTAAISLAAAAGDCQPQWAPTFGEAPGLNAVVEAMVTFDDGSGSGEALIVAGDFTRAGGYAVNRIAKWDGASWLPFGGSGFNNTVRALAIFDDGSGSGPALYAGGDFSSAGGVPINALAKWDASTSSWSAVGGGMVGFVWSMTVFDDGLGPPGSGPALYIGGFFTDVGGPPISANRIAKWDGKSWSALGGGMTSGPGGQVRALQVFDDGLGGGPALYAAGSFLNAGDTVVNRIAKWDPITSTWSALGTGMNTHVWDLTVFDDGLGSGAALYAGGEFITAGGVTVNRIAKWDAATSSWSGLDTGMTGTGTVAVRSLVVFEGALHAAGNFTAAGGVAALSFAKWDAKSSTWSALGVGMNGLVTTLAIFDDGSGDAIFAGGNYIGLGLGLIVDRILKWDGQSWYPVGAGLTHAVRALTVFDDGLGPPGSGPALYAGGLFVSGNGEPLLRVAKWNGGTSWTGLGGGVTSGTTIYDMAVFDDGNGPALYVVGDFTVIGGTSINRIAKWDASSGTWSAVGGGLAGIARGLAVFDDGLGGGPALYVGGQFTATSAGLPVSRIAKWDGKEWSALGLGTNQTVSDLVVFDDGSAPPEGGPALYAGGGFTTAGGVTVNRVAKWDGKNWSALGATPGASALVSAMAVYDDGTGEALYIGGGFLTAGGVTVNHVAKWDGQTWSDLNGGTNGTDVISFGVFDDGSGPGLYAGGEFTLAGGVSCNRIARWDGNVWSPLGEGTNGVVSAMAVFDDGPFQGSDSPSLFLGGSFIQAGAPPSGGDSYMAKWRGCAVQIPGDLNGDGLIDVDDLLLLLAAWGPCPPKEPCSADIAPQPDGDDLVNVDDLLLLLANWG